MVVEIESVGRVVMTRVRGSDGRERMELTGSAYLSPSEPVARRQLHATLSGMVAVLRGTAGPVGV